MRRSLLRGRRRGEQSFRVNESLEVGLKEKAKEFVEKGAEVYVKALNGNVNFLDFIPTPASLAQRT